MIINNDNTRNTWYGNPVLFHPILDNYVITNTYEEIMEKGLQNKVNILMGYTFDEYGASPSPYVANNAIREITRISSNQWANLWLKNNSNLNVFQYVWNHSQPGTEYTIGACHTSDIIYFLNTLYMNKRINWSEKDKQIANIMSSYIINFIKTFNPNGQNLPKWEKQKSEQNTVMEVGNDFKQIPLVNNGDLQNKINFLKQFWSTQIAM
ncbi:Carboxylic ester hydrolase [Meloidogyne graminicola]|uniref:Carboxylic ester hydrolase n=1 Tax=Meloidogyne graminicola TaxID=189291 RepID=A0A8S9ZSW5_9BILA|nr:Carboxylic ester hydrolase [Meloidogyne graminicola]